MKTNALASLALAFATAYALADNLGTPTKVGSLSRSTDYVYTADETDTLLGARVPVTRTVNGKPLSADVVLLGSDIQLDPGSSDLASVIGGIRNDLDTASAAASTAVQSVKISGEPSELKSGTTVTIPTATATKGGVLTDELAAKLDGIAPGANAYVHPTYTARTGKPTANAAPGFGGTITVSQITSDATGHVTGATDRTITIPSTVATTSAPGLMSAADKAALDSLAAGGVTKAAVAAALQAQGISSADAMDDMDTLAAKVAAIIAVLEALD